jgi:hypothetical protein
MVTEYENGLCAEGGNRKGIIGNGENGLCGDDSLPLTVLISSRDIIIYIGCW